MNCPKCQCCDSLKVGEASSDGYSVPGRRSVYKVWIEIFSCWFCGHLWKIHTEWSYEKGKCFQKVWAEPAS